jgi:pyruvate/2-oxoglutarate dehydrogenase complex dihydrolipoamide acyltransferase (E2) component
VGSRARLIGTAACALILAGVIAVWHARREASEEATPPPSGPAPAAPAPAAPANPAPPTPPAPAAAAPNLPPDAAPPSTRARAMVARMNEAVLMARLREVAKTDSAQAVEVARAGNARYPDSPDAPERTSILIHALVTQDKLSEARAEAEYMVNHYPDSSWVRDIEGFTGAHRHRNIRVNDAGQLEYY